MEQETILSEISNMLSIHSKQLNEKIDKSIAELEMKMDRRFAEVDKRFDEVDKRFAEVDRRFDEVNEKIDRLNTKFDGQRIELQETQETAEFAVKKVIQHEKKLRGIHT